MVNLEEGINKVRAFPLDAEGNINFCLLMQNGLRSDGKPSLKFFRRDSQPCYGELRPFEKGESRPTDLHHPFPKGNPVCLSVGVQSLLIASNPEAALLDLDFYSSRLSPYYSVTKDMQVIYTNKKQSAPAGLYFSHCDFEPTMLVSFLLRFKSNRIHGKLTQMFPGEDPRFLCLLGTVIRFCGNKAYGLDTKYFLSQKRSVYRYIEGLPLKTKGWLSEREPYNRKYLHNLFGFGHKSHVTADYKPLNYAQIENKLGQLKKAYQESKQDYLDKTEEGDERLCRLRTK